MTLRAILSFLVLALFVSPSVAEQKQAMNYVLVNEKNKTPPKPSTMMQSLRSSKKPTPSNAKESEKAANQAWETYKALAMGQAQVKSVPSSPIKPQEKQPVPPQPSNQLSGAGTAGLLQEYRNTKAKRSQMNTLVVNPASAP